MQSATSAGESAEQSQRAAAAGASHDVAADSHLPTAYEIADPVCVELHSSHKNVLQAEPRQTAVFTITWQRHMQNHSRFSQSATKPATCTPFPTWRRHDHHPNPSCASTPVSRGSTNMQDRPCIGLHLTHLLQMEQKATTRSKAAAPAQPSPA